MPRPAGPPAPPAPHRLSCCRICQHHRAPLQATAAAPAAPGVLLPHRPSPMILQTKARHCFPFAPSSMRARERFQALRRQAHASPAKTACARPPRRAAQRKQPPLRRCTLETPPSGAHLRGPPLPSGAPRRQTAAAAGGSGQLEGSAMRVPPQLRRLGAPAPRASSAGFAGYPAHFFSRSDRFIYIPNISVRASLVHS